MLKWRQETAETGFEKTPAGSMQIKDECCFVQIENRQKSAQDASKSLKCNATGIGTARCYTMQILISLEHADELCRAF